MKHVKDKKQDKETDVSSQSFVRKLCCYVIRTIRPYVSQNTLKIIYYSYFHSVMNYGLLFWGSSTESIKIFKLQKKVIRIIMGYKSDHSCRDLFVALGILPFYSQYIFSLLLFLDKNKNQFHVNSEIYHYTTRQKSQLHQPSTNLTKYQKGVYYLCVKVFNKLPTYIKEEFVNTKKFKKIL
jgi:hypothetical protein